VLVVYTGAVQILLQSAVGLQQVQEQEGRDDKRSTHQTINFIAEQRRRRLHALSSVEHSNELWGDTQLDRGTRCWSDSSSKFHSGVCRSEHEGNSPKTCTAE